MYPALASTLRISISCAQLIAHRELAVIMRKTALPSADEAARPIGVNGPSKAGTPSDQEVMRRLGKQQLLKVHLPSRNLL
jgi:hypothetical protein